MDPLPSPSRRRSVKRQTDPPASATEQLDALRRELEEQAAEIEKLRKEKGDAVAEAAGLRSDLEAERVASEMAASEAMLMIERLQREKSSAVMEARQFRRFAESRADHDRELQDELATVTDLVGSYRSRLESLGIDPELEDTDEEEEEEEEEKNGEDEDGDDEPDADDDLKDKEASAASSSNTASIEKGVVEEPVPVRSRRASGESFGSAIKVEEFPVVVSHCDDKEYGVVNEYVGVKDLYGRLALLEADREEMRKEITALRVERAQLVIMREMARRLCREVAEERRLVKSAPDLSFGALLKVMLLRLG